MSLGENMTGALLDTDFLIDLNRGKRNNWRQRAETLLKAINTEDLYISNITVTEFISGIQPARQSAVRLMLQDLYFYIVPNFAEATLAGSLRQEWLAKGYSLSIADVTNAALAISRKLVLITRNITHYPFENLVIKSW